MKRITRYNTFYFTKPFFVVLFLFCAITATSQVSSLTVISNQNGAPSSLNFSELKSIFMGEQQRWRGGTKITIAIDEDQYTCREKHFESIYGMSPDELNKFWLALGISGKSGSTVIFLILP